MLLQKHKMKLLFTVLLLILGSFILIYISNQNKTRVTARELETKN